MPTTDVGTSEDLLTELSGWVKMETPTPDGAAVNRLMDVVQGELVRAGAAITRIPGRDGYGDNMIARTPGKGNRFSSLAIWTRSGHTARWIRCPTG